MTTVEAAVIAKDFIRYLDRVANGETIVIASHAQPVAELRPAGIAPTAAQPFGLCAGEFSVPEDFDAPLSAEILAPFDPP